MSKIKSPIEKKKLAYDRDHFSAGEYPHSFRIGWPRKEAAASRRHRRKVTQRLSAVQHRDTETAADIDSSDIRRRVVRKYGAYTLRERVARKLDRRRRSYGAKKQRQRLRSLV
jgi:hypothetical protein